MVAVGEAVPAARGDVAPRCDGGGSRRAAGVGAPTGSECYAVGVGSLAALYRAANVSACTCATCGASLSAKCRKPPSAANPRGVFDVLPCGSCALAERARNAPKAKPNNVAVAFRGQPKELTALHRRTREALNLDALGFVPEQKVGHFRCDDVNEALRVIVEVNGDYVHANPKLYKPTAKIVLEWARYTAKEKWAADASRAACLKRLGYSVFVVWESDNLEAARIALRRLMDERAR